MKRKRCHGLAAVHFGRGVNIFGYRLQGTTADEHEIGIPKPQIDDQDGDFGPGRVRRPWWRRPDDTIQNVIDYPDFWIHHASPNQNSDKARNRIGDEQKGLQDLLARKICIIVDIGNSQAEGESRGHAQKGKSEVPGDDAHQRTA